MKLRVAIPDLVSPSYFPLIAAVELGCFREEGHDASLELVFPVTKTYEMLRDGSLHLVGGAAHAALYAFPDWQGGRLLCALAQKMYWFLVMHASLGVQRGDLAGVRGRRIGAAPGPVDGLKVMLARAGIDPAKDVSIGPVPGTIGGDGPVSFGLMAAKALEERKIDGFWANGMGAELAVRGGYGSVIVDARRDGPEEAKGYTFPALVASAATLAQHPGLGAAGVRAVQRAQQLLREDATRATAVGRRVFPPAEAELIAELVRRDAPYYDAAISADTFDRMNRFAVELGLAKAPAGFAEVVGTSASV
jgi:ABC-type nitrate/sulfonate/bicarbonate transport system substrate-binding protein